MKLKSLYLSIFFALLLIGCSGNSKELNKELNKMAYNLNKEAPAQLDENTLFMRAEVDSDNTFKYIYKIINTTQVIELMDEMEAQTKANISEAFRINPDLKIFTDNNVVIEYVYTDEDDVVIRTIKITPEDYKKQL